MIAKKAYYGDKFVYRAYFNGMLIWDYGIFIDGDGTAVMDASTFPKTQEFDVIQMHSDAAIETKAAPETWELDPVQAHADATIDGNATPAPIDTVHPYCAVSGTLQAVGAPSNFGLVHTRGNTDGELIVLAAPKSVGTVPSVSTADGSIIASLCPTVDEVIQLLFDAGATIDGYTAPQLQEPEDIIGRTGAELTAVGFPGVLAMHKVTFVRDGVVLHSTKVLHGTSCSDPVEDGTIATPTKGMTAQYTYEYAGWSLTEGGEVIDESTLASITSEIVLYATFEEKVRYYTITYYDDDGITVLKTQSIAYGSKPTSYTPSKTNYAFEEWYPEITEVTKDASYYAVWVDKVSFATAPWSKIAEVSESGKASRHFTIGDTKDITISVGSGVVTVPVKIIAFDHDNLADGSGKAGITVFCAKAFHPETITSPDMHTTNTNSGGWSSCWARTAFNSGKYYNAIPEEIKEVVKPVLKISDAGSKSSTLKTTTDKFWLMSATEAGYTKSDYSATGQGTRYSLFSAASNYQLLSTKLLLQDVNSEFNGSRSGYTSYFLRSAYKSSTQKYLTIGESSNYQSYAQLGNAAAYNSSASIRSIGFAFGFCI